jgi:serine protease inhibitor
MKLFVWMFLILVAMLPSACQNHAEVEQVVEQIETPNKEVVASNASFAFALYHQFASENYENLLFSPYSVANVLVMTAEGAVGETAFEMGKVLQFPNSARRNEQGGHTNPWNVSIIHHSMAAINQRLSGSNPAATKQIRSRVAELRKKQSKLTEEVKELRRSGQWEKSESVGKDQNRITDELNGLLNQLDQYEIHIANALWAEQTYPLKQTYINTINKYYKTGGVFPVDFKFNYETVRQRVNRWVEDQTSQRIKNLIPTGAVDEYTSLILTNAIYFKGEWATPFEEKYTKERDFILGDGSKIKTLLMNETVSHARYAAFDADGSFFETPQTIEKHQKKGLYPDEGGFAILELSYKGDEISMVIIAPNSYNGLPSLEARFTLQNLDQWQTQLVKRKVHVFLPKFKLETDYRMKKTLQAMGMVRAFEDPRKPDGAQFDGMTASADPMQQLYITQVMHKAFVEVNEKGTEAAAATGMTMVMSVRIPVTKPFVPTFRADRPFLFLIRDRVTGSILFVGRLLNPNIGGRK